MKPRRPGPTDDPLATLRGRRLAAGEASRRRLSERLGLEVADVGFRIDAVAWVEDHVEVALRSGHQTVTLCLEALTGEREAFLSTERLAVWYQGSVLPRSVQDAILAHAPTGLAGIDLAQLAAWLSEDPELGQPGQPMPVVDDYDSPTRGHLHSWAAAEVYADFFARAELVRHQLDSLDLFMKTSCIQHSDMECMCVAPVHGSPIVGLVSFPWDDRHRCYDRRGEPAPYAEDEAGQSAAVWTTSLTEKDVLLGNPDKVAQVLEQAVARPHGGLILFSNTCVPVVTGEDVESVVRHYRDQSPVPLLYLTVTSQSMKGVLSEVMVRRRLAAEAAAGPPDPRAVNLVGFPRTHATAELAALLSEASIRVNEVIVPSVDPAAVERLPRAGLNVYWPNALWQHVYDQLQQDSRIPAITPPAPFGMEGTARWLRAVGEAVGRGEEAESAWQRAWDGYRAPWQEHVAQAAERRLCFVARSSQIEMLTDPAETWGVPLIGLAEEMGFALDVLLHVRGRKSARDSARAVQAQFTRSEAHTLRAFETPAQMHDRLRASEAQAVFSQHTFDWRVTQAGKIPFSLMHVEHGPQGALLTLKRLLGLCGTTFYRRFADYLGRTPDGRRLGDLR